MTCEQLSLMTYPAQTSGREDSLVKMCQLLASKEDYKENEADYSMRLSACLKGVKKKIDPNGLSLKTLKTFLASETDLISLGFCLKWQSLGTMYRGNCSTVKIMASPEQREGVHCRTSWKVR